MFRDLSFINEKGEWAPDRPENYEEACRLGAGYADELRMMMKATGNPTIAGAVFRGITAGGRFDDVEIGFCNRLGVMLIV